MVAPIGVIIPNDTLWRAWSANRDGGGFAYVDENNNVVIKKGFAAYNDFQKAYIEASSKYSATSPFLVHMRIRSQGDHGMNNTHPFEITPDEGPAGALIHNGTLFAPSGEWVGTQEDKLSDTRVFAQRLSKQLAYEDVLAGKDLLGKAIGYSRMAMLYANREVVILNEGGTGPGNWRDGVWFSNHGSHPTKKWSNQMLDYTRD